MRIEVDADATQLKLALARLPVEVEEKKNKVFVEFDNKKVTKNKIEDIVSNLMRVYKTHLDAATVSQKLSGLGVAVKRSGRETLVYYKGIEESDIVEALSKPLVKEEVPLNPAIQVVTGLLTSISGKEWGKDTQEQLLKVWAIENDLLDPQTMRFYKLEERQ